MNLTANYIILPNAYKEIFSELLQNENIDCTFLSSTGLYLKEGQTTCLIISSDDNISEILEGLIRKAEKIYKQKNKYFDDYPGVLYFKTPVSDFKII